jgi:hypothetical protein
MRGFAVVPNGVLRNAELSDGAVRVYAVLLGFWPEHDGTVLATHEQLAQAAGHKRNWAVARVAELSAEGLLEWDSGGRGRPNRYRLLDVVPRGRQRG